MKCNTAQIPVSVIGFKLDLDVSGRGLNWKTVILGELRMDSGKVQDVEMAVLSTWC